jgi:hypothetical protein
MPQQTDRPGFGPRELKRFLVAVDAHLTTPAEVVLIGGGAVAVGYGGDVGTQDLDTFNATTTALQAAAAAARQETGLAVPLDHSTVADAPYEHEARLRRVLPRLRRLTVKVLEQHDLALSKVVRGYDHDLEQIEELHRRAPLDQDLLVRRFIDEMGHAVGNPRMIALAFLECIERLFGELARSRVEQQLRAAGRLG